MKHRKGSQSKRLSNKSLLEEQKRDDRVEVAESHDHSNLLPRPGDRLKEVPYSTMEDRTSHVRGIHTGKVAPYGPVSDYRTPEELQSEPSVHSANAIQKDKFHEPQGHPELHETHKLHKERVHKIRKVHKARKVKDSDSLPYDSVPATEDERKHGASDGA